MDMIQIKAIQSAYRGLVEIVGVNSDIETLSDIDTSGVELIIKELEVAFPDLIDPIRIAGVR